MLCESTPYLTTYPIFAKAPKGLIMTILDRYLSLAKRTLKQNKQTNQETIDTVSSQTKSVFVYVKQICAQIFVFVFLLEIVGGR